MFYYKSLIFLVSRGKLGALLSVNNLASFGTVENIGSGWQISLSHSFKDHHKLHRESRGRLSNSSVNFLWNPLGFLQGVSRLL